MSALLLLGTSNAQAADIENGKKLYKYCSLCHGKVGQGVKGGDFPKIGGLPKYYLLHQHELFVSEQRYVPAMNTIGRMDKMTDKEKDDLYTYIASIDIQKEAPTLTIPTYKGDAKKGKKLYKSDCKSCHGSKAEGKPKKEAPPTSWQYSEYLHRQIDLFKKKERHHDNDPDDETFDDYTEQEIIDILTFISTLDDE
jgi:cytochrome c553